MVVGLRRTISVRWRPAPLQTVEMAGPGREVMLRATCGRAEPHREVHKWQGVNWKGPCGRARTSKGRGLLCVDKNRAHVKDVRNAGTEEEEWHLLGCQTGSSDVHEEHSGRSSSSKGGNSYMFPLFLVAGPSVFPSYSR